MRYTYIYRDDFIEFSLGLCEVMAFALNLIKHFALFTFNGTIKKVLDELEEIWKEGESLCYYLIY